MVETENVGIEKNIRNLVSNPAIRFLLLLGDEPTGNLDPGTSDQVFGALMDLVRGTGLAAVVATHNLELAARMDRIVRLDAGPDHSDPEVLQIDLSYRDRASGATDRLVVDVQLEAGV